MATRGYKAPAEIKSGYLVKQGSKYRTWKKRYFVLKGKIITYFGKKGDDAEKGIIDLSEGRGIRKRNQCALEWPKDAEDGLCFGLATEYRTYFLYGTGKKDVEEWMSEIQKVIRKVGKPTDDWKNDPEGTPEPALSKAMRGAKKVIGFTKALKDSGLLDESAIGSVKDAIKDSVDSDLVEGACDLADNKIVSGVVSTAAGVVKDQIEADGDLSLKQRLALAGGSALGEVSELVDNDIASGALKVAGDIVKDQAEADENLSLKQRLALAGGSALGGASEFVDNDIASGVLNAAGSIVKDQAEADKNTSLEKRLQMGVESAVDEFPDLEQFVDDRAVKSAAKGIKKLHMHNGF